MNLRSAGIRLLFASLLTVPLAAQPASPPATPPAPPSPASAASPPPGSPLVSRTAGRGFVQIEAPSFAKLSLKEKRLAYHLSRAAIQLDPIFYDQQSAYGLQEKRLIGALVEKPERLPDDLRPAILAYATAFFANSGNHNVAVSQKFVPRFSFADLSRAAEQARARGARLGSAEQLARVLKELEAPLFDMQFEPVTTQRNPPAGQDILTASSTTFYRGVKLADLEGFTEKYPLNSRLVKKDGKLVEEVYRAGTPDRKVLPGLFARELQAVVAELEKAAALAEPGQAKVLRALARYYQTGEAKDWRDYNVLWVQDDPTVELSSGFIEVYRDARGVKGSAQMVVAVIDRQLQPLIRRLAENAAYFEKRSPWEERFKDLAAKPPVAKAVETLLAGGDFGAITIGSNLPNDPEIRTRYGTKSFLLTSAIQGVTVMRGPTVAAEFLPEPEAKGWFERYGRTAENLRTALHEVVGHGSGKKLRDPATHLREYYSTVEEARADLVALWHVYDPKLAELGIADVREVGRELYRQIARSGLVLLKNYPTGDKVVADHDRAVTLIANYLIEAGGFEQVRRNDKLYNTVKDYDLAHAAVGKLLAEVMRITAEGDYAAAKALIERYGLRFDPAVRDEVAARFKTLDLPILVTGIYSDLTPVTDKDGKVTDVVQSYPRDFLAQQIAWARENGTLGWEPENPAP